MSVSGSGIDAKTTITAVDSNSVTLNNPITSDIAKNGKVTFSFNLPAGIVQHFEPVAISTPSWTLPVYVPSSVATAVISLTSLPTPVPSPPPLNITVQALRANQTIPVDNDYYNVLYLTDSTPSPGQYQTIPLQETALYITLPPLPKSSAVDLEVPSDGTPPKFENLIAAMLQVLGLPPPQQPPTPLSPAAITAISNLTTADQYQLLAYEIVWSQQNTLPLPPDLYQSTQYGFQQRRQRQ